MNIAAALEEQAAQRPEAAAIIDTSCGRDRTLSFAQLNTEAAQVGAMFEARGLRAGDAVLILQPMSAELYVLLVAIFRCGLVAMFIDPSAGRAHIEHCCRLWQPAAFAGSRKAHLLRLVSGAIRRIPHKFCVGSSVPGAIGWDARMRYTPSESIAACDAETPALLTFTSGSTGRPKAAVRTHRFLLAQHRVLERNIDLRAGQIDLATLPVFVLANLASGVTSLLPDADLRRVGAINPAPVAAQIERHRPDRTAGSPAFFARLCDHGAPLSSMRQLFTGGAPVFPATLQRLRRLAPNARLTAVYGSTEAEPIAHLAWDEIAPEDWSAMASGKGLLAGRPVDEIELRIIENHSGKQLPSLDSVAFATLGVDAGKSGEIVVTGPHVLSGYLHGEGDEETKIRVGDKVWHRTGDAGYLDARGRLWLLGRCSARVSDAKGVLYPFAVECVAMSFPFVVRCAFAAVNGKRWLALELNKQAADLRPLEAALSWAHIDHLETLHRIPVDKRHNAKIDYTSLDALLRRRCSRNLKPR
jgi:acyl-CoA synthetase (AMP-forming)/AMP-acid ligase II